MGIFFFSAGRARNAETFLDPLNILCERNSLIYRKFRAINNEKHFTRVINVGETFLVCLSAANSGDLLKKYETCYSVFAIAQLRIVWKNWCYRRRMLRNFLARISSITKTACSDEHHHHHPHTDTARQSVTKLARAQCEPAFARENRIGRLPKSSLE
jgi:hypothetical protein